MYRRQFNVLVVDDDPVALCQTVALLQQRDYAVRGAQGIQDAASILSQSSVDLLVSGLRLRGMSGLQFLAAARQHYPALAGILLGNPGDEVFEAEAACDEAWLLVRPVHPPHFLMVVAEKLASIRRRQRWPRKRVGCNMPASLGGTPATLVDVSYGGLRLALHCDSLELPSTTVVAFPAVGLEFKAHVVWSSLASDGVTCVCGAAIADDATMAEWRRLVDWIPQAA